MRHAAFTTAVLLFLGTGSGAYAQEDPAPPKQEMPPTGAVPSPAESQTVERLEQSDDPSTNQQDVAAADLQSDRDPWLDRAQRGLHHAVSSSSRRVDRLFGANEESDAAYQQASGSIAPALLWDEFNGFKPRLRFRANFPLPNVSEKFDAFVGRVNRDEYVTERAQESGAFRRQYGPVEDDQTLLGISYRETPKQGGRWDAGAGIRVRFPLDPYVKGSYLWRKGELDHLLFSIRETAFWQNSENLGLTTRFDFERIFQEQWMLRFTGSTTVSQETEGMRGYSALTAVRGFPSRRAVTLEVGLDGETEAEVPLHDYGFKAAYRQAVTRNWLVMEVRTSLRWPKEELDQTRKASWGVGIGFEMFFGTDEFLARPVTF